MTYEIEDHDHYRHIIGTAVRTSYQHDHVPLDAVEIADHATKGSTWISQFPDNLLVLYHAGQGFDEWEDYWYQQTSNPRNVIEAMAEAAFYNDAQTHAVVFIEAVEELGEAAEVFGDGDCPLPAQFGDTDYHLDNHHGDKVTLWHDTGSGFETVESFGLLNLRNAAMPEVAMYRRLNKMVEIHEHNEYNN